MKNLVSKVQMKRILKFVVTALIVPACNRLLFLRPYLRSIGIRTEQSSYVGRKLRVQLQGGGVITLTNADKNYMTFELFWKGRFYYEPLTTAVLGKLFERNHDTFIDVGANVGYFSLIHGAKCLEVGAISFEPSQKLLPILKDNVATNGSKITVESKAVSKQVGTQRWFQSRSDMSGSLVKGFREDILEEYEVETVSLDAYLSDRVDLQMLIVKIDVESHEPDVLRGMFDVLEKRNCEIVVEGLNVLDDSFTKFIDDLGYKIYSIQKGGLVPSPNLGIVRAGNLRFLNYYITRTDVDELDLIVKELSENIDFIDTTNYVGDSKGSE